MAKNFEIKAGKQTPDFPAIMLATIVALKELGGKAANPTTAKQIIKNEEISEEEQSYVTNAKKRQKLGYYLTFSRTRLKMMGALENPKHGVWALTKEGYKIKNIADARRAFELSNIELKRRSKINREAKKQNQPTT